MVLLLNESLVLTIHAAKKLSCSCQEVFGVLMAKVGELSFKMLNLHL